MKSQQPWHQRFGPVRAARSAARRTFFRVLRKTFATDDGRAILNESLHGQLEWRPRAALTGVNLDDQVYGELGRLSAAVVDRRPVIITARFRTGSTALWNAFRRIPSCTAYYEPLNERRWFDPLRRGVLVDATHRGVTEYWREYTGMQDLGRLYRDSWTQRDLYMDERSWNPQLSEYVETLINRAAGLPVLQFNEIDFRLPWFRAHFPTARILHLYRHPREQWCSSLFDISLFPHDAPRSAFAPHDHFYLERWVRDLKYTFPFLDDERITHPYDQFYLIWKLSYLYGRAYADRSVRYEHIIESPGPQLRAIFHWLDIDAAPANSIVGAFGGALPGRWKDYASADWFESRESRCQESLREFFETTADERQPAEAGERVWPMLQAALEQRRLHEAAGGEA